jgi:hypothetical protein
MTFWEVVALERGPFSLLSTTEEPLGRKSSGSGIENRECGRGDLSGWIRGTLYPWKLALTSLTSGGRPVGIVLSRIQGTEFSFSLVLVYSLNPDYNRTLSDATIWKIRFVLKKWVKMQRFTPDSDKLFLWIRTDIYCKFDKMGTRLEWVTANKHCYWNKCTMSSPCVLE